MNTNKWSLVISSSDPSNKNRHYKLPSSFFVILILIVVTGTYGFIRLASFTYSYCEAELGVYQKTNENKALSYKIKFLGRFTLEHAQRVNNLVEFEDLTRLQYGLNSIAEDLRKAGVGGKPDIEEMVLASLQGPSVAAADSVKGKISELMRQVSFQNKTFTRMVTHVKRLQDSWAQRPSISPTPGRITSPFGRRVHPFTKTSIFHEGIDIANREWTPVISSADGIIKSVVRKPYYGNLVIIDHHGNGYTTRYAHLNKASVVEGQVVRRGEMIGYMGNTGRSTGPHLHYEVRKFGRPINPEDYILPLNVVVD